MENVKEIVEDIIARRFLNPVYSTFFFISAILHWGFLYSLLALDQEYIWKKYHVLKDDYLFHVYICSWWFWLAFFLAGIITYLLIWYAPKHILLPADKEDNVYRKEKEIDRLKSELAIKEALKDLVTVEKEIAQEKKEKTVSELETVEATKKVQNTQLEVWQKEYTEFRRSLRHYTDFKWIVESIYQHGGSISWRDRMQLDDVRIPQGILAYADVKDIINISQSHITLTPKGKFFMEKYTTEVKV
jgi:hypothetical protein